MVRRATYAKQGLYDAQYGLCADVDMWMRLAAHGNVGYVAVNGIRCPIRESWGINVESYFEQINALIRIHRNNENVSWFGRIRRAKMEELFRLRGLFFLMKNNQSRARKISGVLDQWRRSDGPVTKIIGVATYPFQRGI